MTAPVPWEQLDHAQIYEQTRQGQGPGVSMPAEAMWRRVAEIVEAGEAAMDRAVRRSEGMWEGSAGDGARDGLHVLNSWARDAATDALNTTTAVIRQAEHAGRLRETVPEPDTEQYRQAEIMANENLFHEGSQQGFLAAQEERRLRDEDAREKMRAYHFHAVENRALMDYWTTPPTVVVEAAAAGPVSGGGPGGGAGIPPGSAIADALNPAGGTPGSGAVGTAAPGAGVPGGGAIGAGTAGAGGAGRIGPGSGGPGGVGARGAGAGGAGGGSGIGAAGDGRAGAAAGAGASGAPYGSGGAGGAVPAGRGAVPPTPGRVPTPGLTGRDALPPGAGGRGPRIAPAVPSSPVPGGAIRPAGPHPTGPLAATPSWRDVVAANRVPGAAPPVVPGEPAPRTGGGQPGTAAPAAAATTRPAVAGGAGHGMYPPMMGGGTSGQSGETRRRAPYLLDDQGIFDVEHELYYVEPVIRGTDQER